MIAAPARQVHWTWGRLGRDKLGLHCEVDDLLPPDADRPSQVCALQDLVGPATPPRAN